MLFQIKNKKFRFDKQVFIGWTLDLDMCSKVSGNFHVLGLKALFMLPRGGNLKDPSNWRPITQTLLPAKMLEKIVQKRFFKILNEAQYISNYQYGFIPGRSIPN